MKYYKLDEGKVIDTAGEIPQDMWERKGLLPYLIVTITDEIYDGDLGLVIEENIVKNIIHKPIIPLTLEQVKDNKKKEIKSTYIDITNEGFECSNGIKLDCRAEDKINWLFLQLKGGVGDIKDFNNNVHSDLTPEEVMVMLSELSGYYEKILVDKWKIQNLVDAAITIEEVNEIYWRKAVYLDEDDMEFSHFEYNEVL